MFLYNRKECYPLTLWKICPVIQLRLTAAAVKSLNVLYCWFTISIRFKLWGAVTSAKAEVDILGMKKYLAEIFGTFGLTLAVSLSLGGFFPVPTPVIAALAVGLLVYTIGHISGTHINPAVTIGLLSIGKIEAKDALGYIIAQFIGAGLAVPVARLFIRVPLLMPVANTFSVGLGELLGALFLVFGIVAVVYGKAPAQSSGIVIGGSLLLGISFAASVSNGVLNPAVALGIGSFSFAYLWGPIVGAVLGAWLFKFLSGEK